MTSAKPAFAPAAINETAIFWLNSSDETKQALLKAGAGVPVITDDDRFVAAQRRVQQTQPKAQP